MHRILAIAINTFREAVRDKVLYGVVVLACGVLVFTLALAELSLDQQARVVSDIGLASISLFSVVVAVFLGSSLLYKEIERKTLYVILPKPIERWEFLVGKFIGIAATGFAFVLMMGAVQFWVAATQAGLDARTLSGGVGAVIVVLAVAFYVKRDASTVILPWAVFALGVAVLSASRTSLALTPIAAQLVLTVVELMVMAAVALLFSSFSTPFLTGGFTLGVWVLGRSADAMMTMPARSVPPEVKSLLGVVSWVVPNNDLFVPGRTLFEGPSALAHPWVYVGQSSGYGLAYIVVVLALASVIFARRDFA